MPQQVAGQFESFGDQTLVITGGNGAHEAAQLAGPRAAERLFEARLCLGLFLCDGPNRAAEEGPMPYIQCNVQSGLPSEKKRELALELTKIVHETIGSPMQYIHVGISEIPSEQFVESGQLEFRYSKP